MRTFLRLPAAGAFGLGLWLLGLTACNEERPASAGPVVSPGAGGALASAAGATANAAGVTAQAGASGAGGHVGSNAECCTATDPCGWADDGICDCSALYAWDAADCGGTMTQPTVECCAEDNPCAWQLDGFCDCNALYAWDTVDCENDVLECCTEDNECQWADDGLCNCGGIFDWDALDCSMGSAPEGWTCATAYYEASDGCDCGCGVPDPDCNTTALASCSYCWGSLAGGCSNFETQLCPGTINPENNALCTMPVDAAAPDAQ
jgi:hypothetical protein